MERCLSGRKCRSRKAVGLIALVGSTPTLSATKRSVVNKTVDATKLLWSHLGGERRSHVRSRGRRGGG